MTRAAVRHLHYRGFIALDGGVPPVMGPNLLGELLYPVEATYDPGTGRTTVGLSYIAPPTDADPSP